MTPAEALEGALRHDNIAFAANHVYGITNYLHALRFTVAPMEGKEELIPRYRVVREFARAILHGDDEHRAWLIEAADAFASGKPMPPARNANGIMGEPTPIRDVAHWNKVGPGVPLGPWLETMHQDEYQPKQKAHVIDGHYFSRTEEQGINLCQARIILSGEEIEWTDKAGSSTLVNGSFKAPTHWRWQNGAGI